MTLGGDIRQYLVGPPGPPGPPGAPGPAGDEFDDVANRVLSYIQSMNHYITQLLLHRMLEEPTVFLTAKTMIHSGLGRGYDRIPGPPGPPGPPGSISVNDIISLLQRKSKGVLHLRIQSVLST